MQGEGLVGMNLLTGGDGLTEYLEMEARVGPSCQDGAPALVVTYRPEAPLPWRNVRDEFRAFGPDSLLGMTVLDRPGARSVGTPFLLERDD